MVPCAVAVAPVKVARSVTDPAAVIVVADSEVETVGEAFITVTGFSHLLLEAPLSASPRNEAFKLYDPTILIVNGGLVGTAGPAVTFTDFD